MKLKTKNIKLTRMDKLTLIKHFDICTDLHGKGCAEIALKEKNKLIN